MMYSSGILTYQSFPSRVVGDVQKDNGGLRPPWTSLMTLQGQTGRPRAAIPISLLCMIVNWSERKSSGPRRDEVL